jgi:quercetin dioxygenase-like cupin family protein
MTSTHNCFCELVPLYALNILDTEEQSWVEQQMAECPELAEELTIAQDAVSALAYTVLPVTPAPDLKQRLFHRLTESDLKLDDSVTARSYANDADMSCSATSVATSVLDVLENSSDAASSPQSNHDGVTMLSSLLSSLKWKPYQVPGTEIVVLNVNHRTSQIVCLFKAEAGKRYPLHSHAGTEEIFMLAGDLVDGDRIYRAGDYIRSEPGSTHAPITQEGCIFLVRTSLSDKFLETVDKPSLGSWLQNLLRL